METMITMTKKEYDELFYKFVAAWMEYQQMGYGCKIVSNGTGEAIIDKETILGSFVLPWSKVFKKTP